MARRITSYDDISTLDPLMLLYLDPKRYVPSKQRIGRHNAPSETALVSCGGCLRRGNLLRAE